MVFHHNLSTLRIYGEDVVEYEQSFLDLMAQYTSAGTSVCVIDHPSAVTVFSLAVHLVKSLPREEVSHTNPYVWFVVHNKDVVSGALKTSQMLRYSDCIANDGSFDGEFVVRSTDCMLN